MTRPLLYGRIRRMRPPVVVQRPAFRTGDEKILEYDSLLPKTGKYHEPGERHEGHHSPPRRHAGPAFSVAILVPPTVKVHKQTVTTGDTNPFPVLLTLSAS